MGHASVVSLHPDESVRDRAAGVVVDAASAGDGDDFVRVFPRSVRSSVNAIISTVMPATWTDPVVLLSGTALAISGLNAIGTWMLGTHDAVRDIARLDTENTQRKAEHEEIKRLIDRANTEWSKKTGDLTTHLGKIDVDVSAVKTELLLMRGYRRDAEGV